MNMGKAFFFLIISSFLLAGCCGPTGSMSSSGSCPYGTFGESCTNVCNIVNQGDSCFTKCMDQVRNDGLGDATTCCKKTVRMECDEQCTALEQSTHGDTTKSECMDNCLGTFASTGLPLDSCAGIQY